MADSTISPYFSIIIPTRDRPELFSKALRSVMEQSYRNREILVIVDGSSEENLAKYKVLENREQEVQFHYLPHRPNGHGQSYSMNVGSREALGQYLCFLDDDDSWEDPNYLEVAHSSLCESPQPIDMHYSNQKGYYSDNLPQSEDVWLEDLLPLTTHTTSHINDTYFVDAKFLLKSKGFGHLNCSIFRKDFYFAIGGMDESIRYENDRDVFIRSIDQAQHILYNARYISRHNIPDVSKKQNMSTIASSIEKKLYQIRVYDKGVCQCNRPEVRRHCKIGKTYELKHLTNVFADRRDYMGAAFYARQALVVGFNFRWLVFTLYLGGRSLFQSAQHSSAQQSS